jgi:7-carboxy-7-deazaguanine synthase
VTATAVTSGKTRGLLVNETFGPTFQGEGPSAGQQAFFVRLATCNLTCTWCDSRFSWDWNRHDPRDESHRVAVDVLAETVLAHQARLIVVTGGEPLLQQEPLIDLLAILTGAGRRVEVETNGTLVPDPRLVALVERFNVSPKLAHAAMPATRRLVPAALRAFTESGKAVFKIVLTGPGDVAELAEIQREFGLDPVWVMPEATTPGAVLAGLRALAEPALAHGWNLGTRLHVLVWGDRRGR